VLSPCLRAADINVPPYNRCDVASLWSLSGFVARVSLLRLRLGFYLLKQALGSQRSFPLFSKLLLQTVYLLAKLHLNRTETISSSQTQVKVTNPDEGHSVR